MLNWNKAQTVRTDYAEGDVTRVTLPKGHVSFNLFQKDDYWLCWVQAGDDVIFACDVKFRNIEGARARAETMYGLQWAALCTLDRLGT